MGIFNSIYHSWQNSLNKDYFQQVCEANNLKLSYQLNKDSIAILKEIFINRVYSDYFPFYQKANIIDLGAHKGYFSLFSAINCHNTSKIVSLEPFETNFNILLNNLRLNNITNVYPVNSGIYSETGKIDLHPGKSENNSIFTNYNSFLRNNEKREPVKIHVLSLKDLLEKHEMESVDFLKIDCEGAEYPAVFAASGSTLSAIKTISMEFHDLKDERFTGLKMVNFLELHGFKIVKFSHEPSSIDNNFGKLIAVRK